MTPIARNEGLLVQTVGDETIIYDQQRSHAHRLNRTAALVWQACNGQRTITDLTETLRQELGVSAAAALDDSVTLLALDRLHKGHLLQEPFTLPDENGKVTRREVIRKVALVGGMSLLIPLVQTMVAPTPAMALSIGCAKRGHQWSPTRPCCPGLQDVNGICLGHV